MRAEVKNRGLITYGDKAILEERLQIDDTYGVFRGDLMSMSENHLRQVCIARKIPCVGKHQRLVESIEKYNRYKRDHGTAGSKPSINAGLPLPDELLGKPTGELIPGTRGSRAYLGSYDKYIQKVIAKNGTTENAATLRYWRKAQHLDESVRLILCECLECLLKRNSGEDTDNKA